MERWDIFDQAGSGPQEVLTALVYLCGQDFCQNERHRASITWEHSRVSFSPSLLGLD